jgi:hypothetical protein
MAYATPAMPLRRALTRKTNAMVPALIAAEIRIVFQCDILKSPGLRLIARTRDIAPITVKGVTLQMQHYI